MKGILFHVIFIGSLITLWSCANNKPDYNPNVCLAKEKQEQLLREMVFYTSKLPPEATHKTKKNPEFKWYYDKAVGECNILFCLLNNHDSTYQILVARQARSITPMQEGIALKMKFNDQGDFDQYEEVFRTWKMHSDTLAKRGKFLFDQMVNGGDLSLYQSKFQKDKFIEFPDDRFTFDIEERKWRDRELDSLKLN